MRSRFSGLSAVLAIGALALVSFGGEERSGQAAAGTGDDIIRDVKIRFVRRCQVALLDVSLTREAPVGLRFVGRVPFGRQRAIRHSLDVPLATGQPGAAQAENGVVRRTIVWDLTYPNGNYLAPRTHRGKFRALDQDKKEVLDTFPVELRIPKSFYKGSLEDCGRSGA